MTTTTITEQELNDAAWRIGTWAERSTGEHWMTRPTAMPLINAVTTTHRAAGLDDARLWVKVHLENRIGRIYRDLRSAQVERSTRTHLIVTVQAEASEADVELTLTWGLYAPRTPSR